MNPNFLQLALAACITFIVLLGIVAAMPTRTADLDDEDHE